MFNLVKLVWGVMSVFLFLFSHYEPRAEFIIDTYTDVCELMCVDFSSTLTLLWPRNEQVLYNGYYTVTVNMVLKNELNWGTTNICYVAAPF